MSSPPGEIEASAAPAVPGPPAESPTGARAEVQAEGPVGAPMGILIIRPDRVGDVILSTPVLDAIRVHYPRARITVMVRESVAPLLRGHPAVDAVMIYDPEARHRGLRGWWRLWGEFRALRPRIAVVLQTRFRLASALFLAGVRYRVGPYAKPHSFLFFNRGVRQRRSQVEMHETDYNLQLLRRIGVRATTRQYPTRVGLNEASRGVAREWLLRRGWDGREPVIAVHPGMGGSALNWPESHYLDLIRALIREGRRVLVTAGPGEDAILAAVRSHLKDDPVWYYGGRESGEIDVLAGLFSWVSVVVAPSTGPLHLAVALGRPVVTFYPPVRVQSAIRWGPYTDEARASVLVPEVYCGEDFKCRGALCNYYPCMRTLTVAQALREVALRLRSSQEAS